MEKRIELEKRARKANEITELNLDNCRSTSIVGLTDEYTALETLSLINVGLTTLKGFPKLPNLKKLELSDNRISNGLNYLTTSPKLQYLNLSGNKIKDLDTLKPLKEFKHLADLDLFNNEATQIENYREKIFKMLPSLKFLDGFDCNDVEAPSEGDDDEEANGVDSDDDDKQNAFCLNGLEIDLNELEEFEKRLKAKRKSANNAANVVANNSNNNTDETVDDLDEYLKELKLKEEAASATTANTTTTISTVATTTSSNISATTTTTTTTTNNSTVKLAILLYWFLAILNLANAAYYSSSDAAGDGDDGEEEGDEEDFDVEDDDDVSLSEVYNDDLEEDNSDWDEGDAAGVEDEDEESDEDDAEGDGVANESATKAKDGKDAAAEADEEPQARGKKRKHDG